MIYLQRLPLAGSNLIVKGEAYNFDLLGMFKRKVSFRYINLERVKVVSYLTQGNVAEVAEIDDNGDVVSTEVIPMNEAIRRITVAKGSEYCLGVLIRNVILDNVSSTNYIVIYRGR